MASELGTDFIDLEGKLDSGADLCALPVDTIEALDLPPLRTVRAAGFAGTLQGAVGYRCALQVAGQRVDPVELLATRRSYAIIGRNVLRHFVVKLDGPESTLSIAVPKRKTSPSRQPGKREKPARRR